MTENLLELWDYEKEPHVERIELEYDEEFGVYLIPESLKSKFTLLGAYIEILRHD